jgi:hypothetical protein
MRDVSAAKIADAGKGVLEAVGEDTVRGLPRRLRAAPLDPGDVGVEDVDGLKVGRMPTVAISGRLLAAASAIT